MKFKQNPAEEVVTGLISLWIHRKGNEAYAAIFDTIEAKYSNLKPIILKRIKLSDKAWRFIITLPPGLSYAEFKKQETLFSDALGGVAQIDKRGKTITMEVSIDEIAKSYPYSFDPSKYKGYLPVHFGFSSIGEVVKDLASMPNLIIAGHPGAGKSNFIHGLIMALMLNQQTDIHTVVFDFKKLEYSYLEKHLLLVTEEDEALKVFQAINKDLDERLNILKEADVVNIQEYLKDGENMPYMVVIIDELAEMHEEECQTHLNRILRLGRAAGICVVCATQRPSSTMMKAFGDSKAMFAGTMCFHVRDGINSRMLLDNENASIIPNIPGRGIYQFDKELETQGMFLPVKEARKMLKNVPKLETEMMRLKQPQKRLPPN